MPHPHLTVETSPDGYRWLRLARPERRNALPVSLLLVVTDALACEPEAPVVLGSTDPRVFCAGAGLAGRGAGVKAVMAADGLLDRMRAERAANRSAWARAMALPPSP